MITIQIHEEVSTAEDMATVLERITELIQQGYRSGYEPSWSLEGEEEETEDEE